VRLTQRVKALVPEAAKSRMKVDRARAFRRFGSDRYCYPALNRLDRQMIERLPATGVFLEIGANDGYSQSNTFALETLYGWRGILIEPLPRHYEKCRKVRTNSECFNVACASQPGEVVLDDSNLTSVALGLQDKAEEASRLHSGRLVTVPAVTLSSVIDRSSFSRVDFLSIDVEGAELEVLQGLDLDRHLPDFLLVETKHPEAVSDLLGRRLKLTESLSFHDYLWTSED
jgi:FkbM family methyltransferase